MSNNIIKRTGLAALHEVRLDPRLENQLDPCSV